MSAHKTSPAGIEFLERHEGVVLRAYRDPVGIWTIGAGLTKASGVIAPKAGMVLTKGEASALLAQALERNYEPRVLTALPGVKQHVFDGAVSFDFNTGAIHRASWVRSFILGDAPEVRRRIRLWNKAGGRVLPGLVRRREEEANLILLGVYHASEAVKGAARSSARIVLPGVAADTIREALKKLGYHPGPFGEDLALSAVEAFQRDHGLTVDGLVGRATLSTIERRLASSQKALVGASGGTLATATGGSAAAADVQALEGLSALLVLGPLLIGGLYLAWLAYQYRDVIAAKIGARMPRLRDWLRSF